MAHITSRTSVDPAQKFQLIRVTPEVKTIVIRDNELGYEVRIKCETTEEILDMVNWTQVKWMLWLQEEYQK